MKKKLPARDNTAELWAILVYSLRLAKPDEKVEQTLEFYTGNINSLNDGRS